MPLFTGRIYAMAKKVVIPARISVVMVEPRFFTSKGSRMLRWWKFPARPKNSSKEGLNSWDVEKNELDSK